jgi:hypothetical protein
MTSMMIDSTLIAFPSFFFSLHPIAEVHICNRDSKENNRRGYPQNVLHRYSQEIELYSSNCFPNALELRFVPSAFKPIRMQEYSAVLTRASMNPLPSYGRALRLGWSEY